MEDFAGQVARKTRDARQAETDRAQKEAAEQAASERATRRMSAAAVALATVLSELGVAPQCELVEQRSRSSLWSSRPKYDRKIMAVGWLLESQTSGSADVGYSSGGEILTVDGRILVFGHMGASTTDLVSPARVFYWPEHTSSGQVLSEVGGWEISEPTGWPRNRQLAERAAEQITEHLAELAVRHRVDPARLRDVAQ